LLTDPRHELAALIARQVPRLSQDLETMSLPDQQTMITPYCFLILHCPVSRFRAQRGRSIDFLGLTPEKLCANHIGYCLLC
jgi:hypothetical protein